VTPLPLSEAEVAKFQLLAAERGRPVGDPSFGFTIGAIVEVAGDGPYRGERGLLRAVRGASLVVRLRSWGKARDLEFAPSDVRALADHEFVKPPSEFLAEEEAEVEAEATAAEAAVAEAAAARVRASALFPAKGSAGGVPTGAGGVPTGAGGGGGGAKVLVTVPAGMPMPARLSVSERLARALGPSFESGGELPVGVDVEAACAGGEDGSGGALWADDAEASGAAGLAAAEDAFLEKLFASLSTPSESKPPGKFSPGDAPGGNSAGEAAD